MNRREFLHATGAGLGAATLALTPGCRTTVSPGQLRRPLRWNLRQATSSIHYRELSLEAACERVSSLGFEAIDIWSAYENTPHLDDALNRLGASGLQDLLARTHLRLSAFSTYVGGYAKYAKLLGGIGGGVAIQGSAGPCPPSELNTRMRAFFSGLKPLAELAEANQSWLAIENHGQALLDGLDSFRAFVELNPYSRVGLALAPYHLQTLQASVEDAIRICGPQLLFFYAWQNQPGTRQLPGLGPTDFAPWVRRLREVRYRNYVNAFMHGHIPTEEMDAALTRSRDYLNRLGA